MTITLTREEAQQVLDDLEALTAYIQGIDKGIVLSTRSIELLRARLAQPEPEPVAWRFDQAKYRKNDLRGRQWAFNVFLQSKPYMDEMVRNVTPLYTAPQKREWQGLTDEEIEQIVDQHWEDLLMFAEAIEANLKEKNTL